MSATAAVAVFADTGCLPDELVHAWRAALPTACRTRADGLQVPGRFRQFVVARHLLAQFVAARADLRADDVAAALTLDSRGRPHLDACSSYCSISHSVSSVMVAFSRNAPIGVDIERHKPRNLAGIVQSCFHADEQSAFATLEPAARTSWFYRLWTLKEAAGKALGIGLSSELLGSLVAPGATRRAYCLQPGEYTATSMHHAVAAPAWFKADYAPQRGEISFSAIMENTLATG